MAESDPAVECRSRACRTLDHPKFEAFIVAFDDGQRGQVVEWVATFTVSRGEVRYG